MTFGEIGGAVGRQLIRRRSSISFDKAYAWGSASRLPQRPAQTAKPAAALGGMPSRRSTQALPLPLRIQGELVQHDFALPGLQQRQCIRTLAGWQRGKH